MNGGEVDLFLCHRCDSKLLVDKAQSPSSEEV